MFAMQHDHEPDMVILSHRSARCVCACHSTKEWHHCQTESTSRHQTLASFKAVMSVQAQQRLQTLDKSLSAVVTVKGVLRILLC